MAVFFDNQYLISIALLVCWRGSALEGVTHSADSSPAQRRAVHTGRLCANGLLLNYLVPVQAPHA